MQSPSADEWPVAGQEPVAPPRRDGTLMGYADPLIVRPGERVRVMVSAEAPEYTVDVVRVIHGDEDARGPGFTEVPVETAATGTYPGRRQIAHAGSYVSVPASPLFDLAAGLTLQAWIYPTTPRAGRVQNLLGRSGYGLVIHEDGDLALRVRDVGTIRTGQPMVPACWYFVAATYDIASATVHLRQEPIQTWPDDASRTSTTQRLDVASPGPGEGPFLIGAARATGESFNGKVDRPRLFGRALDDAELDALRAGSAPDEVAGDHLVAAWDFAADITSDAVTDTSGNALHGAAANLPARAVTGYNWTGDEVDWRRVPEQYGAIHFHDDDLEDAGWEADFEFEVSDGFRSGLYAARLTGDGCEDHVPFVVVPGRGEARADIAFLMPTMTYLAYGNSHLHSRLDFSRISGDVSVDPLDRYLDEHPEFGPSAYDLHADGSPVCYASWRRPIPNLRPKYRMWWNSGPEHLGSDLYLVDWLEHKGFDYEVITDHNLHEDGTELLSAYRVIVTGGHPEYWTTPMKNALQGYLAGGGRLMYLGGNGFYWVTAADTRRPHVVEVRRGNNGIRSWDSDPGEVHTSLTGERGGLWRYRGWAPQRVVGVGTTAQGFDPKSPGYRRRPESFDERAAFIFEGIGDDEIIGNFGLLLGGAAASEIDRVDAKLGTPAHALRVASSEGDHSDMYQLAVEDLPYVDPAGHGGTCEPRVRADMVYFEQPNGGAVFSVGSINWFAGLSHNGYDNNVSRVTENVLRRFSS